MLEKEAAAKTKNLLISDNSSKDALSDIEPIWLILTTKKFMTNHKRLKPSKVLLPHSLHTSPNLSICIITPDPQRQFKDAIAHPSFPISLSKRITKVVSIQKLESKYRSFESKRKLRDSHDVFLADDRIVTYLANCLGKTFYNTTTKRPIPISLEASKPKEGKNAALPSIKIRKETSDLKSIAAPPLLGKEIERTLSTAQIYLSPSTTTAVRVGLASCTPEQLAANIEAVMVNLAEKLVGWKNVKAVHLKGPNTMALPIWLAEELWVDEGMVLEDDEAADMNVKAAPFAKQKKTSIEGKDIVGVGEEDGKRKRGNNKESLGTPKRKKAKNDNDLSLDIQEKQKSSRKQKRDSC